jgi:hypothetical protein
LKGHDTSADLGVRNQSETRRAGFTQPEKLNLPCRFRAFLSGVGASSRPVEAKQFSGMKV